MNYFPWENAQICAHASDTSEPPFEMTSTGFGKDMRIAEVGGPGNIYPVVRKENQFSFKVIQILVEWLIELLYIIRKLLKCVSCQMDMLWGLEQGLGQLLGWIARWLLMQTVQWIRLDYYDESDDKTSDGNSNMTAEQHGLHAFFLYNMVARF